MSDTRSGEYIVERDRPLWWRWWSRRSLRRPARDARYHSRAPRVGAHRRVPGGVEISHQLSDGRVIVFRHAPDSER